MKLDTYASPFAFLEKPISAVSKKLILSINATLVLSSKCSSGVNLEIGYRAYIANSGKIPNMNKGKTTYIVSFAEICVMSYIVGNAQTANIDYVSECRILLSIFSSSKYNQEINI